MGRIKDYNFVHAEGWMRNVLHLSGDELWVYAIIFQMSQDGASRYCAGNAYIREWLDCTENTAAKYINRLIEKGFIRKHTEIINNVKFCNYSAILEVVPQNFREGTKNYLGGDTSKFEDINKLSITKTKDNNIPPKSPSFIKPTISEIQDYCESRNNGIDATRFYDYYEANGWKVGRSPMKDWKAAVRNWENRRKEERNQPQAQPEKESNFAYMMRLGEKMFGKPVTIKNDADEQF